MDRRVDLALGFITVALGIVILYLTTQISTVLVIDPIGSRGFGYFIGASFVIGGAAVALHRMRHWHDHGNRTVIPSEGAGDEPDVPVSTARPMIVIAATLIYTALLEPLGFLLATPLYLGFLLHIMQSRRPLLSRVVLPIVFTIVVYFVFAQGLSVRIPVGPFRSLFIDWGLVIV